MFHEHPCLVHLKWPRRLFLASLLMLRYQILWGNAKNCFSCRIHRLWHTKTMSDIVPANIISGITEHGSSWAKCFTRATEQRMNFDHEDKSWVLMGEVKIIPSYFRISSVTSYDSFNFSNYNKTYIVYCLHCQISKIVRCVMKVQTKLGAPQIQIFLGLMGNLSCRDCTPLLQQTVESVIW